MHDEIPNGDAPDDNEPDWMEGEPMLAFSRALIIGGIAILVAVIATFVFDSEPASGAAAAHAAAHAPRTR